MSIILISLYSGCFVNSSRNFSRNCGTVLGMSYSRATIDYVNVRLCQFTSYNHYLCTATACTTLYTNLKLFFVLLPDLQIKLVLLVELSPLQIEKPFFSKRQILLHRTENSSLRVGNIVTQIVTNNQIKIFSATQIRLKLRSLFHSIVDLINAG